MPQKKSPKKELPPYVRLKTTPALKKVAVNMALMQKASLELRHLEDDLLKNQIAGDELDVAMDDMAYFAVEGAKNADLAIDILKGVQIKMKSYLKDL
jgi:hypothetical protein